MIYPDGSSLAYKADHVGLALAGAERAFEFCRDQLRLPVAWQFAGQGAVRSGGLGLGNLNLELLDESPLLSPRDPAAVSLIAFQPAPPSVEELAGTLTQREIEYQGPITTTRGIFGFTNVLVSALGVDLTFFCTYHYPGSHDNAVRGAELLAMTGGPLGLQGVTELRAALDIRACMAIFGPPTGRTWRFDTGPDLVADASIDAGTAQMTWSVREPEAAAQALLDFGARRMGDLFGIGRLGGLRVRLSPISPDHPGRLAQRRAGLIQPL